MQKIDIKPRVGIGVIIENKSGEILIGKRIGKHAPYYSIPGGKLNLGEQFETAAVREISEETGLKINNPKVIAITNNLRTFKKERLHYISIILHVKKYSGKLSILEPKKCSKWLWCDPHKLLKPHFEASENAVNCYLNSIFYDHMSSSISTDCR